MVDLKAAKERHEREQESDAIVRSMVCSECLNGLVAVKLPSSPERIVLCGNARQKHSGFVKPKGMMQLYKEGVPVPLHTANRLDDMLEKQILKEGTEMVNELAPGKEQRLAKYQGVTSLTKADAREIIVTLWPKAPPLEITKGIALCAAYSLNPLMGHVYLIPFGQTWAMVLGIKAKRLLASRRGAVSYVEDTPRIVTEEEQKKTFGTMDTDRIWVMVKVQDPLTRATTTGYGFWLNADKVHGKEKGNSAFNMASIRAESQALDRLRPGEMPSNVAVVDDSYIEGTFEEVPTEETKQETQDTTRKATQQAALPDTVKDIGELLTHSSNRGRDSSHVFAFLSMELNYTINKPADILDLRAAWDAVKIWLESEAQ